MITVIMIMRLIIMIISKMIIIIIMIMIVAPALPPEVEDGELAVAAARGEEGPLHNIEIATVY